MTPETGGASEREVSWPGPTAGIKLKVGGRIRRGRESVTVDAIEGDVVAVKTGDGRETSIREGDDCPCRADAVA
jgi:hypothetical protein